MAEPIYYKSASELALKIRRRELKPTEIIDAFLKRIKDRNKRTNAYVTIFEEEARKKALEAEKEIKSGEIRGPLHGVPVALKDLFCFKKEGRHTFGAKPFKNYIPKENAISVNRLIKAGAIVLGKTNTPEFGYKGMTDNKLVGATGNPYNPQKTSGGSSGGSAAALAEGLTPIATGSDGGGSIRVPASACGVYGFMPSFGRVPHKYRPDAFSSEPPFIQIGPLARTVEDAALMLDVLSGFHSRDPFSLPERKTDFVSATRKSIRKFKIAYSPDMQVFPVDEETRKVTKESAKKLEKVGAIVEEINFDIDRELKELQDAWSTCWAVFLAELVENFKENPYNIELLKNHRKNLPSELISIIEDGFETKAVKYRRANLVRTDFYDRIEDLFGNYDLLITPVMSFPPINKSRKLPADKRMGWFLTWPFNMTGHPVASVPAGFTDSQLPIGIQMVGPRYADDSVLAASAALERINPWERNYPPS